MVEELYLNNNYLENRYAIRGVFWKNTSLPGVQLGGFLPKASSLALRREIARLPFSRDDNPITHRYAKAILPSTLKSLFLSPDLLEFVSFIIKKKVRGIDARMLRFSAKDYALRHEEEADEPRFDIMFDVDGLALRAGGSIVFVDGSGSYHAISPSKDALTIVKRKRGMQRFVQYHNHYATNRHLALGTLRIDA